MADVRGPAAGNNPQPARVADKEATRSRYLDVLADRPTANPQPNQVLPRTAGLHDAGKDATNRQLFNFATYPLHLPSATEERGVAGQGGGARGRVSRETLFDIEGLFKKAPETCF
jgi:hypothetical protein